MQTNHQTPSFDWSTVLSSWFPWLLYCVAWVFILYFISKGRPFWYSYLQSVVFFNGGIQGLWAAIGHIYFPERTATGIGWQPSGFQTEIGGANLAIGLASIFSLYFTPWQTPVGLIIAVFYAACAYAHFSDWDNPAPCNTGPMLYNTILVSATLFLAIVFQHSH